MKLGELIARMDDVPPEKRIAFGQWVAAHLDAWRAFESLALEAIAAGQWESAKSIVEEMRKRALVERREEFRVNNNYHPYLARLLALKHPQFAGLFEFRKIKGVTC